MGIVFSCYLVTFCLSQSVANQDESGNQSNDYPVLKVEEVTPAEKQSLTDDYYSITSSELNEEDEVLILDTRFSGGCQDHDFRAVWTGRYLESEPPQVDIHLFHDSHNDLCEALLHQTIHIDLSHFLTPVRINLYQGNSQRNPQIFEYKYEF